MRPLRPIRIADDLVEIKTPTPRQARGLAHTLRQMACFEDVVAGLDAVTIRFKPPLFKQVLEHIDGVAELDVFPDRAAPTIVIPTRYGGSQGPDLHRVCDALGCSIADFVELHTSVTHTVELMGFTPGFAYVSGLPAEVQVPRLETPRPRVPAGAVGLSAGFTGIYALPGPGGWPLVGTTGLTLFEPASQAPFLLQPGQSVRFEAL